MSKLALSELPPNPTRAEGLTFTVNRGKDYWPIIDDSLQLTSEYFILSSFRPVNRQDFRLT